MQEKISERNTCKLLRYACEVIFEMRAVLIYLILSSFYSVSTQRQGSL